MTSTLRRLSPFIIAGAAAVAIAAAPTAQATTSGSPECRDSTGTSVCQKQGHASIVTTPRDSGMQWGFGSQAGPLAPIWALG